MSMKYSQIIKKFPEESDCIKYIESIRWQNNRVCPYCGFNRSTEYANEYRYKCNKCSVTFSVTAKTLFHKTRVDLRKWFYVINLFMNGEELPSTRKLGDEIEVTKDTVLLMLKKIQLSFAKDYLLINKISGNE